ncbi:MAG: histidinol-phosphate transaminase [Gammaproteobacteria bacterium RIFCSPHIGHO2_12_FULL_45_9]|nr:MAG: histidinol-phosphate transaminase [Gammaproteobacteria bacterium RIFCSPHIGHO2_12_FULL_45_9]
MTVDFMTLANNHISQLTPYQPGKPIEELEREMGIRSSIKLASNENPLGAGDKAIQAAQSVLPNMHIYPDGGCYDIKQALSSYHDLNPDQITVGNGSEYVLELIVKAYLQKGDAAVISQYAFLTIPIIIQSYGGKCNIAAAQNWGHHVNHLIDAIDHRTRILFLVNPNNPTGTYVNKIDFEKLLDAVPPNVIVVVDEAYSDYIDLIDYPNAMTYLNHYPNLVVVRTFSKIYGLAALRLGYAMSSPDIADILNRARLPFNVNTVAVKAGMAAIKDRAHVNQSVKMNDEGMQQLKAGLEKLNLPYIPSIGNFISIDVNDGQTVYQQLLKEGVIVRPLNAYDMPRHIRVSIGTKEQIQRFLMSLQRIL